MNEKIAVGVNEMLNQCKDMNAATMQIVLRDAEDAPMSAVIAVRGKEETAEIVKAVDAIVESWDK